MSLRVLLADESASIKKVFQLGLQDFAAEVKSVQSGVDVIEVAESFQPDIIFADILLQKLNGYEVCLEMKQHPSLKDVPFILMWSSFMELDQKKYQASGAEGEIEKPFEVDAMRAQIQQLVPSTNAQHIASFLKFPSSIAQEFINEEEAKAPQEEQAPEASPEAPPEPVPTPPVDGMGVISISPAPATNTPLDAMSVPGMDVSDFQSTSHWGSSEELSTAEDTSDNEDSDEDNEENTSVFNRQDGDFEFETSDPETELNKDSEPEVSTLAELSAAAPPPPEANAKGIAKTQDAMDFSDWAVPSGPITETAVGEGQVEDPGSFGFSADSDNESLSDDSAWQSTSLNLDDLPTAIKDGDSAIDGFESVEINKDSEPLDLDSFLYKPGEDSVDDISDQVEHVVVRDLEAIEDEDASETLQLSDKKMEALIAAQVKKQLSSEGIENLVRAHAQEIIKLNIIEQIPQMIEKIAREELDKLLKAEITEAAKQDTDS